MYICGFIYTDVYVFIIKYSYILILTWVGFLVVRFEVGGGKTIPTV